MVLEVESEDFGGSLLLPAGRVLGSERKIRFREIMLLLYLELGQALSSHTFSIFNCTPEIWCYLRYYCHGPGGAVTLKSSYF